MPFTGSQPCKCQALRHTQLDVLGSRLSRRQARRQHGYLIITARLEVILSCWPTCIRGVAVLVKLSVREVSAHCLKGRSYSRWCLEVLRPFRSHAILLYFPASVGLAQLLATCIFTLSRMIYIDLWSSCGLRLGMPGSAPMEYSTVSMKTRYIAARCWRHHRWNNHIPCCVPSVSLAIALTIQMVL